MMKVKSGICWWKGRQAPSASETVLMESVFRENEYGTFFPSPTHPCLRSYRSRETVKEKGKK